MAQQDTGLGWSAESEWLVNGAPETIASISGWTGAVKLPVATNDAELLANGLRVGTYQSNANHTIGVYVGTAEGNEAAVCLVTSGNTNQILASSTTPRCPIYCYRYDETRGETWFPTQTDYTSYAEVVSGLYGVNLGYGPATSTSSPDIPVYPDATTAFNSISMAASPFLKVVSGYAVACVVKWYTTNGTLMQSPILISSNSSMTEMTGPAGYNYARFEKLLSGVKFYMGFWDIPGDVSLESRVTTLDLSELGNIDLERLFMTIISSNNAHVIITHSPDPYEEEGGGSGEEGGEGEDTGDDDAGIEAGSDFPSAINTGFCRIFSPSESELRNLSNYLWSNSYDIAQVKKLFSNPMDSILGLSAVPIRLLGSSVSFSLGGVPITGMTLPMVSQQRYTYHMGSITIKERWGSYLDYDPYTKFSIFLPFIGMRELAADDIMGKTISLVYDIDILTGMCVARLQAGTNCLYEWGGNCAIQLPINSRNWDSVFSTAVSAVGGIMSAVSGGSAPLVAGSVASAALQTVSMKPRIDKSSTIGGAAGWLGQMTPYIIRTTPEAFIPTDQNKFIGYPAYINIDLASVVGYNEVESIHLENVTATGAELEEIESILKGGVIF